MRLLIAAVGKLKQGPERDLFARYLKSAEQQGRKLGLSPVDFIEVPESRAATAPLRTAAETVSLLAKVTSSQVLVCLDPSGLALTSEAFAAKLAKYRDQGTQALAFLIGGADGLGPNLLDQVSFRLSLGPMVLPHGLARIVLAEQLYRAATILSGHPYHRA